MRLTKRIVCVLLCLSFFGAVQCQEHSISDRNIAFIPYPGFPDAHSTWGDIGYNPARDAVYIGVTNHRDRVGLYEYDVKGESMVLKGFIDQLANLRDFQWQGKIHSKVIADASGNVYFSTDGGDHRHLDFMDGPQGYSGGFLMKWDPERSVLTNEGMGLPYDSMKDIDLDPLTGKIYAITFPQVHFLLYDTKKNELRDLGRLGGGHVPRTLFTDQWGNCYYVDWRQRLVKYEKTQDRLVFAASSLPCFAGTPGHSIITGITAYAKDARQGIIYLITYGAKLLAFYPSETGIGEVKDLGGIYDSPEKEPWNYYAPNLNLGNNGKLYYIIGGHGNFAVKGRTLLMEFDPLTGQKRAVLEYPSEMLAEATGSDVKDREGNLYFAGRREGTEQDFHTSKPFMIKFNPEEEVKP